MSKRHPRVLLLKLAGKHRSSAANNTDDSALYNALRIHPQVGEVTWLNLVTRAEGFFLGGYQVHQAEEPDQPPTEQFELFQLKSSERPLFDVALVTSQIGHLVIATDVLPVLSHAGTICIVLLDRHLTVENVRQHGVPLCCAAPDALGMLDCLLEQAAAFVPRYVVA